MPTNIYFDESGFTGENLLDKNQSHFDYASVITTDDEADTFVKEIIISDDEFKIVIAFEIAGSKIDIKEKKVTFPLSNKKNIVLKATHENVLISDTKYLTIIINNYCNYRNAAIDMYKIDLALKLTALENNIGIINENKLHDEYLNKEILKRIGKVKFPMTLVFKELHNKGIYCQNAPEWDPEIHQEIEKITSDTFFTSFQKNYGKCKIDSKINNAVDMLNSIKFEYSSKVKLVLSMTVIEMLAERRILRSGSELEVIEKFKKEIEESSLDNNQKKSLSKAISECSYYSISNLCKKMIKQKLGKERTDEFRTLYEYRSKIIHTGNIDDMCFDIKEDANEYTFAEKAYKLASDLTKKCIESKIN